jgi:hypothetical protein
MHHDLTSIRRASLALGVLFVSFGVTPQAHAADAATQRVALACTQASEASGCQQAVMAAARHATPQRAGEITVAKAQPRRSLDARTDAQDIDGNRFRYDSCGCSND